MKNIIINNDQPNTGWLFTKGYYKFSDGKPKHREQNHKIKDTAIRYFDAPYHDLTDNDHSFLLETTYPGFIVGTGYSHDTSGKDSEGENEGDGAYKISMFFDHVSGMPMLLGSSLKGTLRSVFPNMYKKMDDKSYREPRYALVKYLLSNLGINATNEQIDKLEEEIFTGRDFGREDLMKVQNPVFDGKCYFSPYSQDIFLDAIPYCPTNDDVKLFEDDFITPHRNTKEDRIKKDRVPDAFVNPTPLQFVKVKEGIQFKFRFKLNPSQVLPDLTVKKKLAFFQAIIEAFGAGAKTNVGYGRFVGLETIKSVFDIEEGQVYSPWTGRIRANHYYEMEAKVVNVKSGSFDVEFSVNNQIFTKTINRDLKVELGMIVFIKVGFNKKEEPYQVSFAQYKKLK